MANEKALMQEAWRIGYKDPNGFAIECGSAAAATSTRFALYAATKHLRDGKGEADDTLREALNNCQLKVDGTKVLVQRKLSGIVAQSVLAALGGAEPKTVEDYKMNESLERLMQKVSAAAEPAAESSVSATARAYGARG